MKGLFYLFYNIFMAFWTAVVTIKYTYDRFVHKKYVGILLQKIGIVSQKIKPKGDKKCIWIHATSFGEALSTKNILEKLNLESDDYHVIFSAFTTTGYDLAQTFKGIDQVIILPTDTIYATRKLVKRIDPDLFILTESDYWLNLLVEVKRCDIKTLLIGGRMSDRSFNRFFTFYSFSNYMFSHFDRLMLQDRFMEEKFLKLGVDREKVEVVGNLKVDNAAKSTLTRKLNLPEGKRFVTIGSSHDKEEEMLLKQLSSLDNDIVFIVAPRRPDRFSQVETLLDKMNVSWRKIDDEDKGEVRVILVNKLGVLEKCYEKSVLAIVCGSFTGSAGGHNVYEPVASGCRVLYGTHTYNQNSLTCIVEDFFVGASCDEKNVKEMALMFLKKGRINESLMKEIKTRTEGVTKKTINAIKSLLIKEALC